MAMSAIQPTIEVTHLDSDKLRGILNGIVGSKQRKLELLHNGTVTVLVKMLEDSVSRPHTSTVTNANNEHLQIQLVSILGSLSIPTKDVVSIILRAGTHFALLAGFQKAILSSSTSTSPTNLVIAYIRSIKSVYAAIVSVLGTKSSYFSIIVAQNIPEIERFEGEESNIGNAMVLVESSKRDSYFERKAAQDAIKVLVGNMEETTVAEADYSFINSIFDMLKKYSPTSSTAPIQHTRILDLISSFLATTIPSVRELAGSSPKWRREVDDHRGAMSMMALRRIFEFGKGKLQESALKAVCALYDGRTEIVSTHEAHVPAQNLTGLTTRLMMIIIDSPTPNTLLAAVALRVTIWKTEPFGSVKSLLPILLSLIQNDDQNSAEAAMLFAYLIHRDEGLQTQACQIKSLSVFKTILVKAESILPYQTSESLQQNSKLRAGIFLAISCIASSQDERRREILDSALLPIIVNSLLHHSVLVRTAACDALRGISRSVSAIRTSLVESKPPLVFLLRDQEDQVVQSIAAATICNLLPQFSPVRPYLIEQGCMAILVKLTQSDYLPLRINALWAIKNATYGSPESFRVEISTLIGWDLLTKLISDVDEEVSTEALTILRNLACNSSLNFNRSVLSLLEEKITSKCQPIALQAIYCIVNLATSEPAKSSIAASTRLIRAILTQFVRLIFRIIIRIWKRLLIRCFQNHEDSDIRGAAVRTIINLASSTEKKKPTEIINKLKVENCEKRLTLLLKTEVSADVRERIRDALERLK